MTLAHPDLNNAAEEAAERYATGNHSASFPDTIEKKAFLAGAEWGYQYREAMEQKNVTDVLNAAETLCFRYRKVNAPVQPQITELEQALAAYRARRGTK